MNLNTYVTKKLEYNINIMNSIHYYKHIGTLMNAHFIFKNE
jgi:hypothetical protein